jgi:hypothetical protein
MRAALGPSKSGSVAHNLTAHDKTLESESGSVEELAKATEF